MAKCSPTRRPAARNVNQSDDDGDGKLDRHSLSTRDGGYSETGIFDLERTIKNGEIVERTVILDPFFLDEN